MIIWNNAKGLKVRAFSGINNRTQTLLTEGRNSQKPA
jgi:hypothetical protein